MAWQETVKTSGETITVEVERRRVKRMNLRVRPDGTAHLSIPQRSTRLAAMRFLESEASWLLTAQRLVAERHKAELPFPGTDGKVLLFGASCKLEVAESPEAPKSGSCHLQGDRLIVMLRQAPEQAGSDELWHVLDSFLRAALLERATQTLPLWESIVGRRCSGLSVRRMTSRWGSCNTRTANITLNAELAERDPACLDVVLVHELCHLLVPNHGAAFYREMDRCLPGWRQAQALLDQHPPRRGTSKPAPGALVLPCTGLDKASKDEES